MVIGLLYSTNFKTLINDQYLTVLKEEVLSIQFFILIIAWLNKKSSDMFQNKTRKPDRKFNLCMGENRLWVRDEVVK